jgi:hypothetical protein
MLTLNASVATKIEKADVDMSHGASQEQHDFVPAVE